MGSPPELRQRMSCSQLARAQRSFQTIPSYSLRARLVDTLTLTKETDHGACQPSGELHMGVQDQPGWRSWPYPRDPVPRPEWPWHRRDRRQLRRPNASQHRDPSHSSLVRHLASLRTLYGDLGRYPGSIGRACAYRPKHLLKFLVSAAGLLVSSRRCS